MSNSDKAVKSSQAKTLYDDLRNRHEGVKESIAPEYADLTFPVTAGAHCFHEGVYYAAKQDIPASEAWTAAHWDSVRIGDELSSQKSAINVLEPQASSSDVGKFLKAKTVADGKVSEYEFGEASGGGSVSDVQVNGTSVVSQGVANVPIADTSTLGVFKVYPDRGLTINEYGQLSVALGGSTVVKNGQASFSPLAIARQHEAVFYGLSKVAGEDLKNDIVTAGTYPEKSLSAISQMLNAPVSVSGSTPSITAKAGVRYICGECSTLSITAPASGCIDVVFESGSTPTVLTVSSAKTGVTAIKWANGFDPTSLDANTTYEINILDGEFGVVGSWT